jgi:hypothetical protein
MLVTATLLVPHGVCPIQEHKRLMDGQCLKLQSTPVMILEHMLPFGLMHNSLTTLTAQ